MRIEVAFIAEPLVKLMHPFKPSESSLATYMMQVSQFKRQIHPTLFALLPGASTALYAGFLLLFWRWFAPAKSLSWPDHAIASRTVSMAHPLTTISVVNRKTRQPRIAAMLYLLQSEMNPLGRV